MRTEELILHGGNPCFSRIKTFNYRGYKNITLSMLPIKMQNMLRLFINKLFGESFLKEDTQVASALFDTNTSSYKAVYPPSIKADEEGNLVFLLNHFDRVILTAEIMDEFEASLEVVEQERYKEPCITFSHTDDENEVLTIFSVPLRYDWDKTKKEGIRTGNKDKPWQIRTWQSKFNKGDLSFLANYLNVAKPLPEGEDGARITINKMEDVLEEFKSYTVTGTMRKECNTALGYNWVISVEDEGKTIRFWSKYQSREILDAGAIFEPGVTSIIYYTQKNSQGKNKIVVVHDDVNWKNTEDQVIFDDVSRDAAESTDDDNDLMVF